jgi:hypothetical protein
MRRLALALLAITLALAAFAGPAAADFGFEEFDVTFTEADGTPAFRAGSHPFGLTTTFALNSESTPQGGRLLDEASKDILFSQVAGLVGNPTAVPRCSTPDFLTAIENAENFKIPDCPDSTAVGLASTRLASRTGQAPTYSAVYNLDPPPGVPAKLGFWTGGVPVTIDVGVSEAPPYNIVARATNISQIVEVVGAELTVWGVPAAEVHDPLRGKCLQTLDGSSGGECPADLPLKPFLTMPRSCEGPLSSSYLADSWPNPGAWISGSTLTHDAVGNPAGMSGCEKLSFAPEVTVTPTSSAAESSSGLEIGIDVNDEGLTNPTGIAQADIEDTVFAFPAGMTLNPSAAEGLGVCTAAQFQAESLATRACPSASKLGSLEVETPILENHTLQGAVYLAQQDNPATPIPGVENPFDSLFAAYLVIRDPELGVFVKLATEIDTNETTGQIVATARDLPPFPLSRVAISLRPGPRAPFVTPATCGAYATTASLTPSSGAAAQASSPSFTITSGSAGPCPAGGAGPFAPGFEAGTLSNAAGSYSPFVLRITRQDGFQDITRLAATLPPGVLGKIAGVGRCPDAAIAFAASRTGRAELAAPSCPPFSQVGRLVTGAGVGTALTYVPGSVYLAGPYNGAPLSLAAIVPAVAGPFDVGTVVVRVALRLNPVTAQVEVDGSASDPIPHILKGIPLKLRDLRVFADHPSFTLNATSCRESATYASVFGGFANPFTPADDIAVPVAARYQAASCASLGFKPRLTLRLKGGTKRGSFPALRAELRPRPGDANISKAVVTLPHSAFLAQEHINTICTRVQFAASSCPRGSIYGKARAFTPLLDEPLEGPVYLRSSSNPLPDMVVALHGIIDIDLVGRIDSKNAGIRSSFESTPDAPVSKFVLNMRGGKKGLIVNSRNLCVAPSKAKADLTGQNGKTHNFRPVVKASDCRGESKRRPAHHR